VKNWQKIAAIVGIFAGLPAAATGGWWLWSKAVHATVSDKLDTLNVVILKHDRDIEMVGQSVAWLQWTNYHNRLLNGGTLSAQECSIYRRLSARFNLTPLPC
jgi:hypothetical protein